MIRHIPLQLRSVRVIAPVSIEPCGPACLLTSQESFPYALPGGLALKTRAVDGILRGVLLATGHGTLIKLKTPSEALHDGSKFFSVESHRRALEMLRGGCSEDVSRPERECSCSLELRAMEGNLAWTPFSIHAARIAELFPVHQIRTVEAALAFLDSAWCTLSGLNRSGISHGDPAFYNFLAGERTVLIDLDDCCFTGEAESPWDQSVFLHSTVAPMLGGFLSPKEIVSVIRSLMPDASIVGGRSTETLVAAVASSVEHIRTQRLLRSVAMRSRAVQIEVSETRTKLNVRLTDEHRRYENMLATAEDRLSALQTAHAEMDRLRSIADQRATLLQKVSEQVGDLRGQLERAVAAVADLEAQNARLNARLTVSEALEQRVGVFEAAAAERLIALQEKEVELHRLTSELNARQAAIEELTKSVKTFEGAAAERLVALQEKEEEIHRLTAELNARQAAIEELTKSAKTFEAAGAERLNALQEKEGELHRLTAELNARQAAIEELAKSVKTFEGAAAERLVAFQEKGSIG